MAHEGREPLLKRIWHGLARILCTGIVCPLYRVRAYGMKNVPCKGPLLILCSHQSFLDPIFAQSWASRNFHFVARESLWESKVMAALLNPLFVVPIKQGVGDISAMRRIIAKLKAGCAVCLFPEGSRTWDGTVQEVKPGFGLISRRGEADVVPAVLEGAYDCWPRTRKFPRLGRVNVMYGEVIPYREIERLGDREFARVLTEKLRRMHNELRVKMGRAPLDYSDVAAGPDGGPAAPVEAAGVADGETVDTGEKIDGCS
jgi:1-acyl-sn-glycerol-3-phosphate acyltransferase